MSACQQAKAKRAKMRNGYAHMGNSMRRPSVAGLKMRSVSEAIDAARKTAARMAAASKKKK